MRMISIIISLLFLTFACKKTSLKDSCENLKQGILSDDIAMAKSAVNDIIMTLPNQDYTQPNLQSLINKLNTHCNLTTELLRYDCIYTLPSQSEIRISLNSSASSQQKVMDISYTATNRMTCVSMH
jgi:hypothetical protein